MEKAYWLTPAGNVCYWISDIGAPNTLVFLHGLTADHRLFRHQIEHFQETYNCMVWDAPAHGQSRPYTSFTYPDAANVLLGILDRHGIDTPILVGQSMGGYVIQSFLLRNSGRAKAFISIDSCPYGTRYYSKSDIWWLRQIGWMAKCYPFNALKKAVAKQCTTSPEAEENMRAMLDLYQKNELCHLMDVGYAGFLSDNQDMEIPCPVLLIAGEKDRTGKVKSYNRAWAETTGYPLHWIKNAAHNANDDQPDAVNRVMDTFLSQIGTQPKQH